MRRFTREYAHAATPGWYLCDMVDGDLFCRNESEPFTTMYTVTEELAFVFVDCLQEASDQQAWNVPMASADDVIRAIENGHFQGTKTWPQLVKGFSGTASFYGHVGLLDDSIALVFSERVSRHFRETGPTAIELLTEDVRKGDTPATSLALNQLVEALSLYVVKV